MPPGSLTREAVTRTEEWGNLPQQISSAGQEASYLSEEKVGAGRAFSGGQESGQVAPRHPLSLQLRGLGSQETVPTACLFRISRLRKAQGTIQKLEAKRKGKRGATGFLHARFRVHWFLLVRVCSFHRLGRVPPSLRFSGETGADSGAISTSKGVRGAGSR